MYQDVVTNTENVIPDLTSVYFTKNVNTSSIENIDSSMENNNLILSFENMSRQIHTPIPIVLESVESFGK